MKPTRRRFLHSSSCALMGATPLINTLVNLKLASASVSTTDHNDYKALVCILLSGGNDSWNMLIPADAEPHKEYAKARDTLALSLTGSSAALPLQSTGGDGRSYAVHPACKEIRSLYNNRDLAFIANIGTLIEPLDIQAYRSKSSRIPRSLFSHLDQRAQWQTSVPQANERSGWLGRAAESLLANSIKAESISMNISLAGNNVLQTGASSVTPYNIGPKGSLPVDVPWIQDLFKNSNNDNLFENEYASLTNNNMDLEKTFSKAFNSSSISSAFPNQNKLAQELKAVAKTIAAHKTLGHQRQTFFLSIDGWDHHQDLLLKHDSLLSQLDAALAAFNSAINELNLSDQVTTFTVSDFGRALVSNGDGSDHGWGGNTLIMGGAVKGGQVLGKYPDTLQPKSGQDVGQNGRLLPTTSCDEMFFELLDWFGVNASEFDVVLPNLGNFIDARSNKRPIGIL